MSYQQDAIDAYADILEDGALMNMKRVTLIEDDITGDVTEQIIEQKMPVVVLTINPTIYGAMSDSIIEGSLTAQKSRKCIGAAYGAKFAPSNGDKLQYCGKWWTVLGCSPLNPDGKADIIFEFGIQL